MSLRRLRALGTLLTCVMLPHTTQADITITKSPTDRPNILLILADDLGYGDVSCFRGDSAWTTVVPAPANVQPIQTPCLDRLAAGGLKLTAFYSNDSVCSPTRAALMTGRYQHRSGMVNVLGQLNQASRRVTPSGEEPYTGLRLQEQTVAEILHSSGYRTACFGKWHLSEMESRNPLDQGFDQFVGTAGGAGNNFSMKNAHGASLFWRERQTVEASGKYFTDVLADETINFIQQKSDRPFFVYLPFTSPHVPYFGPHDQSLAGALDEESKGPRPDLHQAYKEVVEAMDSAIGRVHEALRAAQLEQNTLVVFVSDNGPVDYGSCVPFRGRKTNLYEGGIRVPAIAHWPSRIKSGTTSDVPVMTMDLFPTFAALGECTLPADFKLDGISISSLLIDGTPPALRMLFWERGTGVHMQNFHKRIWAVRDGKWKLIRGRFDKSVELYDLSVDPQEQHDLSEDQPEVKQRLQTAFEQWRTDVYSDCPYQIDLFISRLKSAKLAD